jgi:hypothetical protein
VDSSVLVKDSTEDTWPIGFPGRDRQSGTYKVSVHGVTGSGQDVEVGTSTFALQIKN